MESLPWCAEQLKSLLKFYRSSEISKSNISFFKECKSLYKDLIFTVTSKYPQFFPNQYSRILFLINYHKLNELDQRKLLLLYKIFSKTNKNLFLNKEDLLFVLKILADIVKLFFDLEDEYFIVDELYSNSRLYQNFTKNLISSSKQVSFYGIIITKVDSQSSFITCSDGLGEINIVCKKWWFEIPKIATPGLTINAFNLCQVGQKLFETTTDSIIVVEPDLLFDISELASAYLKYGFNAYYYLVNKLLNTHFSFYSFIGNIVNSIFDELLLDNSKSLEEIIENSIKRKIIEFLVLKNRNPNLFEELYSIAEMHYDNLVNLLPFFKEFEFQIEPSFFSAEYGLQGRMDLLLEDKNQKNLKHIVELKSGNFPEIPVEFRIAKDKSFYTLLWHSHYAQTVGYNLLADSVWENRKGSSMILYSQDKIKPLREAVNQEFAKQDFIRSRNWAFFFENSIASRNFKVLDTILSDYNLRNFYQGTIFTDFKTAFQNLDRKYQKLLYYFISFVFQEHKLAKASDTNYFYSKYSQHNLWSLSVDEKVENQIVLNNLFLLIDKSDFNKFHLIFRRTSQTPQITSLRKGDAIVLYHPSLFKSNLAGLIFKGVIKKVDFNEVTISLRNKLTSHTLFQNASGWVIEPDVLDSTFRNLLSSLIKVAYLSKDKIAFLFAEKSPFKQVVKGFNFQDIEDSYSRFLNEAIAFFPYYIIKGPPGTGKTKIIIKNLIEYYFYQKPFNLLVLAYTNRAVDEIAEVLSQGGLGDDFIRLGPKESSDFYENIIGNIVEKHSINTIEKRINKCRIFLATVFSVLKNQEIFALKNFQIAIVDEASQILFPHLIGILAEVDKFILIGDEKQLPAVVLQENYLIDDHDVKDLGFENLGMSYFEFLIRRLTHNGFSNCISMLNTQARMHPSILQIINELFYENKILNHTKRTCKTVVEQIVVTFLSKIGMDTNKRVVFISCPIDPTKKVNKFQAELISIIVNFFIDKLGSKLDSTHLGIVTPYRLQNAEIFNLVGERAKDFVTIDTVERFQGSERNIIFLSLPFNNLQQIRLSQSIFLDGNCYPIDRKLNVAISRAKDLLVILGNEVLLKENMIYKKFIEYLENNTNVTDYSTIKEIFG